MSRNRDRGVQAGLLPQDNGQAPDKPEKSKGKGATAKEKKATGTGETPQKSSPTPQKPPTEIDAEASKSSEVERSEETHSKVAPHLVDAHDEEILESEGIIEELEKALVEKTEQLEALKQLKAKEKLDSMTAEQRAEVEKLMRDDSPLPSMEAMREEYLTREGCIKVSTVLQKRHGDWLLRTAALNNTTPERMLDIIVRREWQRDPYKAGLRGTGMTLLQQDRNILTG